MRSISPTRPARCLWLVPVVVVALAGVAAAYPQYQLGIEPTCTGCHISPAGGGLLDENGLGVASTTTTSEVPAEFLHGAIEPPEWLALGGDLRFAAGAVDNGAFNGAGYPMQAEVQASLSHGRLSLELTGGLRRPLEGGSPAHVLWSREHYAMWRQHPDDNYGLYLRAGRFMPVYGLRLAEHVVYSQRFGGEPLYGETYGIAAEYVAEHFELHATGFVHDSLTASVEHGDGGAFYGEVRIGRHAAIGAEAKYTASDELHSTFGGVTGKLYLEPIKLLLQTELEVVRRRIMAGGTEDQLVGYVLGSRELATGWLLDLGIGHFTQNVDVSGLYRDCLDAQLHWFETSHLELLLTARAEYLGNGPAGGYLLAQVHYRL